VEGDPIRVSICHCLACQQRTGSAFGVQGRFRPEQVTVEGRHSEFARESDEEDRLLHIFHFCPDCGSTVFWASPSESDSVAVAAGAFADPSFPAPVRSIYEERMHSWVTLPDGIEHFD
jgi:hypothetical protein